MFFDAHVQIRDKTGKELRQQLLQLSYTHFTHIFAYIIAFII